MYLLNTCPMTACKALKLQKWKEILIPIFTDLKHEGERQEKSGIQTNIHNYKLGRGCHIPILWPCKIHGKNSTDWLGVYKSAHFLIIIYYNIRLCSIYLCHSKFYFKNENQRTNNVTVFLCNTEVREVLKETRLLLEGRNQAQKGESRIVYFFHQNSCKYWLYKQCNRCDLDYTLV